MNHEFQVEKLAGAVQAVRTGLINENSDLDKAGSVDLARRLVAELRESDGLMVVPDRLRRPLIIPAEPEADPEIALMAHTLAVMRTLDRDACQRFRNWVDERFVTTRWTQHADGSAR